MFSRKHFTWKKWLSITAYMFAVTLMMSWLLSLLLKETPESRSLFFTAPSLVRRLFGSMLTGTLMSFMRLGRKS